jgi:hypothetical protein
VPVRGKLSPRICAVHFDTRAAAEAWLRSRDGGDAVAYLRQRKAVRAHQLELC